MLKTYTTTALTLSLALFLSACEDTPGFDYNAPEDGQTEEETAPAESDAPLSIQTPEDLQRGLAFLPETHTIPTEGGSGSTDYSVEVAPAGVVTASIDEFGDLRLAGVEGATGTAQVTVNASNNSESISDTFTVEVAPYQARGSWVKNRGWLQSDTGGSDLNRFYDLYLPDTTETDLPLVVVLHGAFGNKESLHEILEPDPGFYVDPPTRRWLEIADNENVVLAFPNGLGIGDEDGDTDTLFWNDCRGEEIRLRDDKAFLQALAGDINAQQAGLVDSDNVFIMGVSNGGMMGYRLARETPASWRAIATTIANEPFAATDSEACNTPAQNDAPPVFSLFATADDIMPYDGGAPGVILLEEMFGGPVPPSYIPMILGEVVSAQETINQWTTILGTEPAPEVLAHPDLASTDGSQATTYRYHNPTTEKDFEVVIIDGGKHNLPSREFITPESYRAQNNDIETVNLVWDFFKRHSSE